MKKRDTLILVAGAALIAIAMLAGRLHGTDIPLPLAFNTSSNSLLSASNSGTNHPNATNSIWVEPNLYHTFVLSITCTDSTTVTLDRTLDQVAWIPFSTNTATSTANSEVTILGKWSYVRGRFTGSNASATVLYLGGR